MSPPFRRPTWKNRPETPAGMEKKPTIGNQTEPATDLPHFAILVYVIKPKAGFVGDHNIIRDTLVHIVVDWDCEEVLDKSVCCPVLLAVTKT